MSNIRTIQDIQTDSEKVIMKLSDYDKEIGLLKKKVVEQHEKLVKTGAKSKADETKCNMMNETLNYLEAEKKTLQNQVLEYKKQIEEMKKNAKLSERKIINHKDIPTNDDQERETKAVYDKVHAPEIEELRQRLKKLRE